MKVFFMLCFCVILGNTIATPVDFFDENDDDPFNIDTFNFGDDRYLAGNDRNQYGRPFSSLAANRNQYGGTRSRFIAVSKAKQREIEKRKQRERQKANQGLELRSCSFLCAKDCRFYGRYNTSPWKGGYCDTKQQCNCI